MREILNNQQNALSIHTHTHALVFDDIFSEYSRKRWTQGKLKKVSPNRVENNKTMHQSEHTIQLISMCNGKWTMSESSGYVIYQFHNFPKQTTKTEAVTFFEANKKRLVK